MPHLSHRTHLVAGIFFSVSISAAILACAVWNFPTHEPQENVLFGTCVLGGFLLNMLFLAALVFGATHHVPSMMTPYIVCATMHCAISLAASFYFLFVTVYGLVQGNDLVEVYGLLVFLALSYFWFWSARIIREEKDIVSQLAGKHVPFISDDYI